MNQSLRYTEAIERMMRRNEDLKQAIFAGTMSMTSRLLSVLLRMLLVPAQVAFLGRTISSLFSLIRLTASQTAVIVPPTACSAEKEVREYF